MSGGALVARRIWVDGDRSLQRAEIAWDAAGRIVALRRLTRRAAQGRVRDLAVFPGLVDAHAHLQLAPLPAAAPREFLPWVGAVMAARAGMSSAALRATARLHGLALQRDGVTTIGEIDSIGSSADVMSRLGLAGRCYQELTGFHLDGAGAAALLRARRVGPRGDVAAGWSPHAPYSVSPALFAAANRRRTPLAIHCAELPEEQQFLRTGRGPFRELLARLGRLPADFQAPGVGAVRYLERLGVLRRGVHLVHGQELERGDLPRLVAAGVPVVVCPGTIAWFARTPPPVDRWLEAGLRVAIGTDSAASNAAWSLRGELAQLGRWLPGLSDRQLLAMATTAGGLALHLPGAGRLRRGGRADFVALPVPDADDDAGPLAALVRGTGPLARVHCGGRRIA